jgi:hypothetical protein
LLADDRDADEFVNHAELQVNPLNGSGAMHVINCRQASQSRRGNAIAQKKKGGARLNRTPP